MSEQYRIVPGWPRALAGTLIAAAVFAACLPALAPQAAASSPAAPIAMHVSATWAAPDLCVYIATRLSMATGFVRCAKSFWQTVGSRYRPVKTQAGASGRPLGSILSSRLCDQDR